MNKKASGFGIMETDMKVSGRMAACMVMVKKRCELLYNIDSFLLGDSKRQVVRE